MGSVVETYPLPPGTTSEVYVVSVDIYGIESAPSQTQIIELPEFQSTFPLPSGPTTLVYITSIDPYGNEGPASASIQFTQTPYLTSTYPLPSNGFAIIYVTAVDEFGVESTPSPEALIQQPWLTSTFTVPFGSQNTVYVVAVDQYGNESSPSTILTFSVPIRPYPPPPPPVYRKQICADHIPIPNSSKKPVYTFNRREFWSWGANKTGRNCVQNDTIIEPSS
jgi:hypothetical protein